jgi:glycosyltransferase involved in cell wall biosynthesis
MNNYRYTIIIPHKDLPDYLSRCLGSIPPRDDVQVIVADYGSEGTVLDRVESLVRYYGTLNIEVVSSNKKSKSKSNAGFARNLGLECSKGDWILFADCDDEFIPNNLNKLFDMAYKSDYDVICWPVELCLGNGTQKTFPLPFSSEAGGTEEVIGSNPSLQNCNIQDALYRMFQPWHKMVRLSFIKNNGIRFSEVKVCNDIWYSEQVAFYAEKIGIYNNYVYRYFQRESSLSNNLSKSNIKTRIIEAHKCQSLVGRKGKMHYLIDFLGYNKYKISEESYVRFAQISLMEFFYWKNLSSLKLFFVLTKNKFKELKGQIISALYKMILFLYHKVFIPVRVHFMRKKKVIKVAFVLWDLERWKTESLFREMSKHKRFKPLILIHPLLNFVDNDIALTRLSDYLSHNHYDYCVLDKDQKISDIIKPDIIFYQTPYSDKMDKNKTFKKNFQSLFCYVHYAFCGSTNENFFHYRLFDFAWQIYLENSSSVSMFSKLINTKGRNLLYTGNPFSDHLLNPLHDNDPWKEQKYRKKRIIWAPHHSVAELSSWIETSTFMKYSEFMLATAEKYKDLIQIAFKPHPLLLTKLYKLWGKEKADQYYSQWANMENTQLFAGDNATLFFHSDAMIHDCCSFTIEYMHTKKPVMYLVKDEHNAEDWYELYKKSFDLHYKGRCEEDIEVFINNVIDGKDEMKRAREMLVEKYLLPPGGKSASENIIDAILGEKK